MIGYSLGPLGQGSIGRTCALSLGHSLVGSGLMPRGLGSDSGIWTSRLTSGLRPHDLRTDLTDSDLMTSELTSRTQNLRI